MRPHVLIISPSLSRGGMERQLSMFLRHYDRSKLQVTVALLDVTIAYNIPNDVKIINLNRKFARNPSFYWRLWKEIGSTRYDLINSKISGINELVLLFCGILDKSDVIVEVRNTKQRLLANYKRMSFLFRLFKKDWWVVCNSKVAQREVQEILPSDREVWFVNNGIDTTHFTKLIVPKKTDFTIYFVGRITPQKNVELLIRALPFVNQANKSCNLVLQGATDDVTYRKFLQSEIEKLAISPQVFFVSPTEQDVRNAYNKADLFILPSFYEGTPNVLLEAMSCECVCLCSNTANTDQFLPNEFTFSNNKAEELAEKICWIARLSVEERQAIGKRNRLHVINSYSLEKMVNKMTNIIHNKLSIGHL